MPASRFKNPSALTYRAKKKTLINELDDAAQDHAFKGSMHPDDWDDIETRYQNARENIADYVSGLERQLGKVVL